MFFVGFGLALVVVGMAFLAVWLLARTASLPPTSSYRARAAIHDIERQTIHAMLAAELAAQEAASKLRDRHLP
jgi:hypothetical protein